MTESAHLKMIRWTEPPMFSVFTFEFQNKRNESE